MRWIDSLAIMYWDTALSHSNVTNNGLIYSSYKIDMGAFFMIEIQLCINRNQCWYLPNTQRMIVKDDEGTCHFSHFIISPIPAPQIMDSETCVVIVQ